ncbi:MAG: hypothetical protein ACRD3A_12565 [Terriglobales bacterium]
MTLKTRAPFYLLLALLATALTAAAGGHSRHSGTSTTTHDDSDSADCAVQYDVSFNDSEVYRGEEERTFQKSDFPSGLRIEAARNSGMLVVGWQRNDILIKACKAAAAETEAEGKRRLAEIHIRVEGGEVTATGPAENGPWAVHFLVFVPSGIKLDLDATNGPLAIRNVQGAVNLHTVNGPISIKRCSGEIYARATNGPVELSGSSGGIHIEVQNGPLDINLTSDHWNGAGLEASARNGPISLRVPSGYRSGVEVSSDGHSPFSCETAACPEGSRTWDDRHKIVRLGPAGQPVVVRMSTVNGPVSIHSSLD